MANWSEKFNKMTQSAISKSKEVAEVTKLNLEISGFNQDLKELYTKAGQYVLENGIGAGDETLEDLAAQMLAIKNSIAADEEKIRAVKNINICPKCGASVSRSSRFCDQCGAEMVVAVPQEETAAEEAPAGSVCKNCGAPIEEGALFCGSCGAKQE